MASTEKYAKPPKNMDLKLAVKCGVAHVVIESALIFPLYGKPAVNGSTSPEAEYPGKNRN
ncbi:hypothetical protein GCM10011500_08980 [Mucilaginibacter rubeus]|nr:hypothetical protein GCM10011500_08980 [Mucilaginibacter rubeus]